MNPLSPGPLLVVLVGPPGSGKSTWARANGQGAVHVSQDDLIDAITPGGFAHLYRAVYHAAEDAVARAGLADRHAVVVDRTNRTRAHRERWLRIARECQADAVAVVLNTAPALCRLRNRARSDGRRLSEERMDRMIAAMEPVLPEEGFAAIYRAEEITMEGIVSQFRAREKENTYEYRY
jgi:predicted kinase